MPTFYERGYNYASGVQIITRCLVFGNLADTRLKEGCLGASKHYLWWQLKPSSPVTRTKLGTEIIV